MANIKTRRLSTIDAAKILQISSAYLRKLISSGFIKGEKIGGNWVVCEKDLKRFSRQRFRKNDKDMENDSSQRIDI